MNNDLFDKAFEDFMESNEYDEAQNALLRIANISFQAGWKSAGGNAPNPKPDIRAVPKPDRKSPK